jgi:hypothetical protein
MIRKNVGFFLRRGQFLMSPGAVPASGTGKYRDENATGV